MSLKVLRDTIANAWKTVKRVLVSKQNATAAETGATLPALAFSDVEVLQPHAAAYISFIRIPAPYLSPSYFTANNYYRLREEHDLEAGGRAQTEGGRNGHEDRTSMKDRIYLRLVGFYGCAHNRLNTRIDELWGAAPQWTRFTLLSMAVIFIGLSAFFILVYVGEGHNITY